MAAPGAQSLWSGLREVVAHLTRAAYWTERRDACDLLHLTARQALLQLRRAARDSDPDVKHWGEQYLTQIRRDLDSDVEELAATLDAALSRDVVDETGATPVAATGPAAAPPRDARDDGPRDAEDLIRWLEQWTAEQGGPFERREAGAACVLPVGDARRQRIFLDAARADSSGQPVAMFYSLCGEADPDTYQWALEANASLSRGAFAVIQHRERRMLIMRLRRSLRDLRYATLPRKLLYLARKADWAESRLKEQDRH
ncbi:MAG TPA: hypothetical protein PLS90_02220 [Candidatus Sumerlaeota bacterium]|nr:hypothetical protein [Candidatus Sumerlaeota bacterium]HPK01249.1 hypothetical protein [Candidatus Sumerlaeota bacterium]